MNIVCAYFPERQEYRTLRDIFYRSVMAAMPGAKIHFLIDKAPNREKPDHDQDTFLGFKMAAEYVLHLNEPCAVCDVDLMFRRSIADIWDHDFDIAVTTRNLHAKYNTGLWFFRPTEAAMAFVTRWIELTEQFANDYQGSHAGLKKWAGLDQYALSCVRDKYSHVNCIELPCREWNAEQTCWAGVDDYTRVIHLKSQLRNEIFGRPQNMKYNGVISENIKIIPECVMLAEEARRWLDDNP